MKNKYCFLLLSTLLTLFNASNSYAQLFDPTHVYKIVNPTSGRVVEIGGANNLVEQGSNNFGTSVKADLWDYWGGANQQWIFNPVQSSTGRGAYTITNRNSGRVLMIPDIFGPQGLAGGGRCIGSVQHRFATQQSFTGDDTQMWYIQPLGNSSYSIVLAAYASPLAGSADASNNPDNTPCNRATVYLDRDNPAVIPWIITDVSANPGNNYTASTFQLVNNQTGKSLAVEPNNASDITVKQLPDWGLAAEQWTFTPTSGGYYRIVNRRNYAALEIGGGNTNNGATVNLGNYNNNPWQEWGFLDANDSHLLSIAEFTDGRSFKLYSRYAGKVVQMVGALAPGNLSDDNNEVPATIWNDVGSARQRWHMRFTTANALPTSTLVTDDAKSASSVKLVNSQVVGVYPNPATNVLTIVPPAGLDANSYTVSLSDARGSTIAAHYVNGQLDISSLPIGIYFVKVADGKQIFHQKFAKQ